MERNMSHKETFLIDKVYVRLCGSGELSVGISFEEITFGRMPCIMPKLILG